MKERKKMVRCSSYCVYKTLRIVNIIVNLLGVLMIIYSLWLLKVWDTEIAQLPSVVGLPLPWFIYASIGVGIAVCIITLSGHMVANCISKSILVIYTFSIFSLLLIQAGVIVVILFRIDWENEIIWYIDSHHTSFKSFILFHLLICRLIAILFLVAQTSIVALAAILCVIGTEPTIQSHLSDPHEVITQSFLMVPSSSSSAPEDPGRPQETLKSCMEGIFSRSLHYISRNQS
ncbi:hypothetical protein NMG60_11027916 [Bertholletia excelsa]